MSLAVKPQHRQAPVPILKVGCGPPTLAIRYCVKSGSRSILVTKSSGKTRSPLLWLGKTRYRTMKLMDKTKFYVFSVFLIFNIQGKLWFSTVDILWNITWNQLVKLGYFYFLSREWSGLPLFCLCFTIADHQLSCSVWFYRVLHLCVLFGCWLYT